MTNSQWQLPPGVSAGTREYFENDAIAEDYDQYFAYTSLFQLDESIVLQEVGQACDDEIVADFGCGTGRALVALGNTGFRGLAIDLSDRMLDMVRQKAISNELDIECVKANLVELDGLKDDCVHHGVCLFSTLGMIEGNGHRQNAVSQFRRVIKPGGKLIIHVHNFWYNLYDPGGVFSVFKDILRSIWQRGFEKGDRLYSYRGVYNMYLHVFTRSEIRKLLRRAGFQIEKMIPLNPTRMNRLKHPWFFSSLRCNGWIIVCG